MENHGRLRYAVGNHMKHLLCAAMLGGLLLSVFDAAAETGNDSKTALPKIRVAANGRTFETVQGAPFVPFGVTWFHPGTGWAPQVWKKFDAEVTRKDFARMKELGVNCARVFLTYGSFYSKPGALDPEGLAKFDQFLNIAEEAGIYVHPTGPDHWEGFPQWAQADRYADDAALDAVETFWKLFAARYKGRSVIFAYDLLNEPEMRWDSPALKTKWNRWLQEHYGSAEKIQAAWHVNTVAGFPGAVAVPEPVDALGDLRLLDYQRFRDDMAVDWTRRQARAIKSSDPHAMVTVGLIQWSVPAALSGIKYYAAFRPATQAPLLDFVTIHFYPLADGAYEYKDDASEERNLAYGECVVRQAALCGKPVVLGEFGWYGGGKPRFDGDKHPAATEEQQARYCRRLVETTYGLATGWLNWGFFDTPESTDPSQFIGLVTSDGTLKAWGREFQKLAAQYKGKVTPVAHLGPRPAMPWDECVTSMQAVNEYRAEYLRAFQKDEIRKRP